MKQMSQLFVQKEACVVQNSFQRPYDILDIVS